ncbi:hypothetical protein Bbelb_306570 [Branchiostoma belcheri]|nr:hypothetical protein Bbelb_306570 [Branchiostoma belcheri]
MNDHYNANNIEDHTTRRMEKVAAPPQQDGNWQSNASLPPTHAAPAGDGTITWQGARDHSVLPRRFNQARITQLAGDICGLAADKGSRGNRVNVQDVGHACWTCPGCEVLLAGDTDRPDVCMTQLIFPQVILWSQPNEQRKSSGGVTTTGSYTQHLFPGSKESG